MKLIVGLGNPGPQYRDTRHNIGFRVAEELARRHGFTFEDARGDALMARWRDVAGGAIVAKPLTFMNLSGSAVSDLWRYYRLELEDVLVVTDDVHLPLGRLRARPGGSAGGHNGLKSIIEALGSQEVARLRIGVGRGDERRDLADHVLARFEPAERETIEAAIERAADAVRTFVTDGIQTVMTEYNGGLVGSNED